MERSPAQQLADHGRHRPADRSGRVGLSGASGLRAIRTRVDKAPGWAIRHQAVGRPEHSGAAEAYAALKDRPYNFNRTDHSRGVRAPAARIDRSGRGSGRKA